MRTSVISSDRCQRTSAHWLFELNKDQIRSPKTRKAQAWCALATARRKYRINYKQWKDRLKISRLRTRRVPDLHRIVDKSTFEDLFAKQCANCLVNGSFLFAITTSTLWSCISFNKHSGDKSWSQLFPLSLSLSHSRSCSFFREALKYRREKTHLFSCCLSIRTIELTQ